jgi:hypothetical protein
MEGAVTNRAAVEDGAVVAIARGEERFPPLRGLAKPALTLPLLAALRPAQP